MAVSAFPLTAVLRPVRAAEGCATPAHARQPGARFYLPELDLLRLGAFLMVWSAHACFGFRGLVPAALLALINGVGSLGVPIFFFLSAYLITERLRRERLATGTVHLRKFYVRRMLRIWPLYLGILTAYAALGLVVHGFRVEPGRLAASLCMAGNWYLADHPGLTTPLRHLWSLSVEEQWYLVWPLAARALPATRLLGVCGLCFVLAYGTLAHLAVRSGGPPLAYAAWLSSGVQFQYFALGAAAALLLGGRIPRLRMPVRVLLAAAGLTSLVVAASACSLKQSSGSHPALLLSGGYLLAALGTAMLFFAALGAGAHCCPRPLVRLGQLSFGLYVFHETAFFLADALLRALHAPDTVGTALAARAGALVLAVALAWLSYRFWELPFLRLKQRWTLVRTREPV